jgi:hypothetical protein
LSTIINDSNLEQLYKEVEAFVESIRNNDRDGQLRTAQHLLKKFALFIDDTRKMQKLTKVRPLPTYVGQLHNRAKAPIRHKLAPIADKKWLDGNMPDDELIEPQPQEPILTPEQIAEIRRKYNIQEDESTYEDYRYNESPEGKLKVE